jgi:hypothetical protein
MQCSVQRIESLLNKSVDDCSGTIQHTHQRIFYHFSFISTKTRDEVSNVALHDFDFDWDGNTEKLTPFQDELSHCNLNIKGSRLIIPRWKHKFAVCIVLKLTDRGAK